MWVPWILFLRHHWNSIQEKYWVEIPCFESMIKQVTITRLWLVGKEGLSNYMHRIEWPLKTNMLIYSYTAEFALNSVSITF